jgi:threonine/homoserine/homoserine lactone efflux protein
MITILLTYAAAATLLTITPGLDTAMVLRTAAAEGPRRAVLASAGILSGLVIWGLLVALGLGALLAASELAYTVLKWVGAAYLAWLGLKLILKPRTRYAPEEEARAGSGLGGSPFVRGFLCNILNPKVGVFYVSFLPQFVPAGANVPAWTALLVGIHAILSVPWFALLIAATAPLGRMLRRPEVVKWLDRTVGAVFLGFGAKLALSSRH